MVRANHSYLQRRFIQTAMDATELYTSQYKGCVSAFRDNVIKNRGQKIILRVLGLWLHIVSCFYCMYRFLEIYMLNWTDKKCKIELEARKFSNESFFCGLYRFDLFLECLLSLFISLTLSFPHLSLSLSFPIFKCFTTCMLFFALLTVPLC